MDFLSAVQYVVFLAIVTALLKPLGGYVERVFSRKQAILDRLCVPVERLIYRLSAIDPDEEMSNNLTTAVAMMAGRFALAFAACFARQRNTPSSSGTLPTHSLLFGILLTACLITMVALSYLPALALGPILERLLYGT